MTDDDQATRTRRALFRLEILDDVVAARERHTEVSAIIAGAADTRAAISAIAELLGVTDVSARATSDLPWRRLMIDTQADTRAERDASVATDVVHRTRLVVSDPPETGSTPGRP